MGGIIGIDNGFGQVKATDRVFARKMIAAVAVPSAFQIADDRVVGGRAEDNLIVEVHGQRYVVGQAALSHANVSISTTPDKSDAEHDYVKLLAMLGLASDAPDDRFTVVTGLPVFEHLPDMRARLSERWTGSHNYLFCGVTYRSIVDGVRVIPQAAGAFYSVALDTDGNIVAHGDDDVLVIDIGYRTTDVITMRSARYASDMSGTIMTGMGRLHNEIRKRIHQSHRYLPTLAEMDEIVRHGEVIIGGHAIGIGQHVQDVADSLVTQIINELGMYVTDLRRVSSVLLAGGGANILGELIADRVTQVPVRTLPNPEYANATGYRNYGRLLQRAGKLSV